MEIGAIGYNYRHDREFVMERPDGTGCYLLLLIKDPSVFVINGVEQKVKKNSMVLFSPETPYRYYGDGGTYTDDWMYFNVTAEEGTRLMECGLCDTVYPVTNMEELSQIIRFMAFEFHSLDPYHKEILMHYTQIFFYNLCHGHNFLFHYINWIFYQIWQS